MFQEIQHLLSRLSRSERRRLCFILALSCIAALAELVTIGSMVPFLVLVTNAEPASQLKQFLPVTGLGHPNALVMLAMLLAMLALASAGLRLLLIWRSQTFAANFGSKMVQTVYSGLMRESIETFDNRSTSEILSGIEKIHLLTYGFLMPLLQAATSAIIAICIICLLVFINPLTALVAGGFVTVAYWGMSQVILPAVCRNSSTIASALTQRTRILQESLGAKREIAIGQSQPLFEALLMNEDHRFRRATSHNAVFSQSPRLLFESTAIIALVAVTFLMASLNQNLLSVLPGLGALALGVQRLLPLVQAIWNGISQASGSRALASEVMQLCGDDDVIPETGVEHCQFGLSLEFERVGYVYPNGAFVLSDVSFSIKKGERIGVMGPSGAGKSTLLDLILGLRAPSSGQIRVDGNLLDRGLLPAWQRLLAHVSDKTLLVDGSILANVCFGQHPDLWCPEKALHALKIAQLAPLIASLADGLDSRIGENGAKVSSGQRQRIGIARALYKRPSLLILDEATNGIDTAVEKAMLHAIDRDYRDLTIIIISHRMTAFDGCSQMLNMKDGKIETHAAVALKQLARASLT